MHTFFLPARVSLQPRLPKFTWWSFSFSSRISLRAFIESFISGVKRHSRVTMHSFTSFSVFSAMVIEILTLLFYSSLHYPLRLAFFRSSQIIPNCCEKGLIVSCRSSNTFFLADAPEHETVSISLMPHFLFVLLQTSKKLMCRCRRDSGEVCASEVLKAIVLSSSSIGARCHLLYILLDYIAAG